MVAGLCQSQHQSLCRCLRLAAVLRQRLLLLCSAPGKACKAALGEAQLCFREDSPVLTPRPRPVLPPFPASHDRRRPTFGCVVYVGHAAILQLHRLTILKGERLCEESKASHPLELVAMEAPRGRAGRPPSAQGCAGAPHLSVSSPGECTQWSRLPVGTLALQAASPLGRRSRDVGQAGKGLPHARLLW